MKIIHTGDVHLGAPFDNLPKEKSRIRRVELLDSFIRLCAYARENDVSAVLIAGDLFDENQTPSYVKKQVFQAVEGAKPVQFFYVLGNHDDEFSESGLPSNLLLFSWTHTWCTYSLGEGVVISGLDTKNLSAQTLSSLALSPSQFNVVLLHGDIYGKGREAIDLRLLENKNVDYLALGHIHKPDLERRRLDARGSYRYCGCLEGRGFDEIGKRGFFLLEIEKGVIVSEKVLSFSNREVREVRVDISACQSYFDVENTVMNALSNVGVQDVVKLTLIGSVAPSLKKDKELLTARLSQRLFFVKIVDESRIKWNPADYANDTSERGEFVKEVGRYAMNERQRDEILEIGLKAIAGEEIDL